MATGQLLLFPVSTRPPLSILQNTRLISFCLQSNRLHIKTFGVRSSKPCTRYRPLSISSKLVTETSKDPPEDFMTKVLKENPSQLEPRFLVGGKFLTLREMEALPKNKMEQVVSELASKLPRKVVREETVGGEGTKREEPVYLNDILREFKGKLYVPEGMFRAALSEEEDFDKNVRELPKLSLDDLITYLQADKIKLLTSKSPTGILANVRHRDFIVDLKEIPGVRSLQQTKWAIKLSADEARDVLAEYTGPQYEIEKHTSCAGKLLEYPNPVASSIANRILVELGVVTAVVVFTAVVAYGYMALAVYVAARFLYANFKYIIWPLAEPLLELVLGIVSKIAESSRENIIDTFSEGGLLSKLQDFYTFGGVSSSLTIMKPILLILTTMVLLIRFTISRRQKNYKKWDIWQGIEFSQSKAHARADGSTGVLFSDVAGIDEAVEELKELVEYLKNPKLFDEKGIKPPHGVLLEGPPGCGKTLVAKAIAGEAGVPFYQMAGSEFVEILVGVGSARIRDLFKRAKVNKPSVVFIDEIDALAARRQGIFNETTHYLHNVNIQERETTLNQLLIELDGFDTGKGVIFLGATNRMDLLDPALLRPGRFDRKIRIRPPGAKGRLDILRVHASKVNMSSSVDLSLYAQNLPGWSGAQLAQLLQEAALIAVRNSHESIIQSDMDNAVDRLTMGPIRVGYELGNQGQSRRAVTEVGTAITSLLLRRYENANIELCERISIHPRGQTLSQIVFRRLDDEAYMLERKPQLLHRLQVLLGGRAAEAVIHGRDTSEASSNYLADASWLARKILTIWNLENPMTVHGEPAPWWKSIKFVGPRLDFEGSLYDDYGMVEPPLNSSLEDQVARRTEELVQEMYKKTFSLLRRHQAVLIKTVKVLLDRKEIRRDHMEYIINTYPAETPVSRVLEEKNPEWLPIFESENEHHKVLLSAHPAELSLS